MFGDDRLRGLGVAGGQILAFPIDFDCRPYVTLTSRDDMMMIGSGQLFERYFIVLKS